MPMLINDRDLLFIEPSAFIDAQFAGTILVDVNDAEVVGTSATSVSAGFAAKEIAAGRVAVVAGRALEVLDRSADSELQISLPRALVDDPAIGPGDGASLSLKVITFERAIQLVQDRYLLSLGAPRDPETGELDGSAILNPESLERCIGLRVIAEAFESAAAAEPDDASLASRALLYAKRAGVADQGAGFEFDVDAEGQADGTRRLGIVQFRRG